MLSGKTLLDFFGKLHPIRLSLNRPAQDVAYFLLHGGPMKGG